MPLNNSALTFAKWVSEKLGIPEDKDMQQSYYSQDDIDYLNSIINGDIDPLNVDFDKLEAIGEKNETDPLLAQALAIVSEALDKASS